MRTQNAWIQISKMDPKMRWRQSVSQLLDKKPRLFGDLSAVATSLLVDDCGHSMVTCVFGGFNGIWMDISDRLYTIGW